MSQCDLHFKVFNSPYLLGSEALLIIDLCASGNHISIFCVLFNDSNNSNMQKVVLWKISLIMSSKHPLLLLLFLLSFSPSLSLLVFFLPLKTVIVLPLADNEDGTGRQWCCGGPAAGTVAYGSRGREGREAVWTIPRPCPQELLLIVTLFHNKSNHIPWEHPLQNRGGSKEGGLGEVGWGGRVVVGYRKDQPSSPSPLFFCR